MFLRNIFSNYYLNIHYLFIPLWSRQNILVEDFTVNYESKNGIIVYYGVCYYNIGFIRVFQRRFDWGQIIIYDDDY